MSNYFNENGVLNSTLMNCADDWNLRRKKKKKRNSVDYLSKLRQMAGSKFVDGGCNL
jgi:hypothetical protein